jgi:hypothetical protein
VTRISTHDDGGIVAGWLVKLILIFGVVALVAFDGIAIAYGRVTSQDNARSIAQTASDAMILNRATPQVAIQAAQQRATSLGVVVAKGDISIAKNGAVTVHVHRVQPTILVQRIPPLAKFGVSDGLYTTAPLTN